MRLALLSDIHGNMEALNQVLLDIGKVGVDAIVCLGDIIGYGPEPNQAIASIEDLNIPSVIGNHELAVVDPGHLHAFNPFARISLEITTRLLTDPSLQFIHSLEKSIVMDECRLVHGFPPDSCMIYLAYTSDEELHHAFRSMTEEICFVGHTHELEIISCQEDKLERAPLMSGKTRLRKNRRYIINIGSVGQPRDGNNKAKYIVWDNRSRTVDVRYIAYDIKAVADKILALGLPHVHAKRLW